MQWNHQLLTSMTAELIVTQIIFTNSVNNSIPDLQLINLLISISFFSLRLHYFSLSAIIIIIIISIDINNQHPSNLRDPDTKISWLCTNQLQTKPQSNKNGWKETERKDKYNRSKSEHNKQ